jgi:trk system potassium uptake protein
VKIIVVGCGRLGSELAVRLFLRGHEVTIVDRQKSAFINLPITFTGRLIEGDALNRDVLHRARIEQADALAAVTNSDALNMVVGQAASNVFNVPRVVVRNYDPDLRSIYEVFGLQMVSSTSWGAQRIEEMMYHSQIRTIFSAGNGEVEIYEVTVPEHWDKKSLSKLVVGTEYAIAALTRSGRSLLPALDMTLQTGDVLHISATFEGIEELRKRLSGDREEI